MKVYTVDAKPVGGHYPRVDWGEDVFPTPPTLDDNFDDGLPNTSGPKSGMPLYGGALPKVVRWDEPADNPPPDFDNMPTMNVSERAKQVIESIEPNTHQFFPVEYIDRQDQPIETRYWFYICNRRNTIHPTKSNMALNPFGTFSPAGDMREMGWDLPPHVDPKLPPKTRLDSAKLGDAHMWREARSDGGMRLMSETMWDAIQAAGLNGLRPSQMETV